MNMMKKILLTLIILIFGLGAFADDQQEVLDFFNNYINASNNYSPALLKMYSDDAKIIRQVIKPDGTTADAHFSAQDYKKQMKISAKLAKLKNYKNYYSNIKVIKVPDGYRIDSMRKPSASDYKLKSRMVVKKQPDGKWLIMEELMQTKEQIFLKYVK